MKGKRRLTIFFFEAAIAFSVWLPAPVMAVQGHGGAEGLVAHQIGHVMFVLGIGYLLYKIHIARFRDRGWFEFKAFLWLLTCWNILTFSGHWMQEFVHDDRFIWEGEHIAGMYVATVWDLFFYLTRLDHLLLLPAFILLFLALNEWRRR